MALIIGRPRGLEWLWESFYFRSHSRLRCLRLLPLRRRPTSCAKLAERARLVTVAPTLSPMPNGKHLSGAAEERLTELKAMLEDMRRDRDAWREQAQTRLLPAPASAMLWWRWLRTTG